MSRTSIDWKLDILEEKNYLATVNLQTQTALLAAIFAISLAIGHAMRSRRTRLNGDFVLLCSVLAVWYASRFVLQISQGDTWQRVSLVAALVIPYIVLRFHLGFLARLGPVTTKATRGIVAMGMVLLVAVFTPYAMKGAFLPIVGAYALGVLGFCVYLINERRRTVESRVESTRLLYLTTGTAATLMLNLLDLRLELGIGNIMTTLYLFFLSQTLLKYRLLDLNEFLGKGVVLSVLALVLATIYSLLVLWVGDKPTLMLFNTLVASFVIMVLFEPLRIFFEERINPIIFRRYHEFERRLEELRKELANVIDVEEMANLVVDRLDESRRITHTSLYVLEDGGLGMRMLACRGPSPPNFMELGRLSPLVTRLTGGEKMLLREDLERQREETLEAGGAEGAAEAASVDEVLHLMEVLKSGVCVPIRAADRIIGFLNLNDDRLREAYSLDELARLTGLAAQVGITVENSRLYCAMRERDRLAALGEMAAGLAHEIRNPLGAIKGAAQFIESGMDKMSEPNGEFLNIIVEEVNRLNRVVAQFLDYARPIRDQMEPVDVNEVLQKSVAILKGGVAADQVRLIKVQLGDQLPKVFASAQLLHQVFLNLGLNAFDALEDPNEGALIISSQCFCDKGELPSRVVVRFEDNGMGIPQENIASVFIPFFTTKEGGSGLGLAICERIVRSMGGKIDVVSGQGKGACFSIILPAHFDALPSANLGASRPKP